MVVLLLMCLYIIIDLLDHVEEANIQKVSKQLSKDFQNASLHAEIV